MTSPFVTTEFALMSTPDPMCSALISMYCFMYMGPSLWMCFIEVNGTPHEMRCGGPSFGNVLECDGVVVGPTTMDDRPYEVCIYDNLKIIDHRQVTYTHRTFLCTTGGLLVGMGCWVGNTLVPPVWPRTGGEQVIIGVAQIAAIILGLWCIIVIIQTVRELVAECRAGPERAVDGTMGGELEEVCVPLLGGSASSKRPAPPFYMLGIGDGY